MKQLLIILFLSAGFYQAGAQESPGRPPVSVGYFSHYGFQPGLKIGTMFPLAGDTLRQWVFSPQLGFFTNPGDDTNALFNLEVGYKRPKSGKHAYSQWSAGLGYLHQSKLQSFSINLGNGNTGDRQRVGDNFLLPTISYEYGWATHRKISWYLKPALGIRLLGRNEHSTMLLLEFGIRL